MMRNSVIYHKALKKAVSLAIITAFVVSSLTPPRIAYAQGFAASGLNLPAPGTMVTPSIGYNPAIMAGMTIYPENPLQFDFIIDAGDDDLQGEALERESKKLVNYFLATLAVPEDEMWVNLSPYEADRIVAEGLGVTEMGRDMLAQDYMLKQLTASLMYPEEELGEAFWKKVYAKSQAKFGTTEIPTDTFHKVWIIPQEALVYVNGTSVFVSESRLKVLLEEDYLALESNQDSVKHGLGTMTKDDIDTMSEDAKEVIREVIIPEIEREVNEGKNFANLRQIYNSMILATWYKKNLRESALGQLYMDQNKMNGIDLEDKSVKEKIYNRYVEAFQKGVYNYIREDRDPLTDKIIPRKYFSGGFKGLVSGAVSSGPASPDLMAKLNDAGREYTTRVRLDVLGIDSQNELGGLASSSVSEAASPSLLSSTVWPDSVSERAKAIVENGFNSSREQIRTETAISYLTTTRPDLMGQALAQRAQEIIEESIESGAVPDVRVRAATGYVTNRNPSVIWSPGIRESVRDILESAINSSRKGLQLEAAIAYLTNRSPDVDWSFMAPEQAIGIIENSIAASELPQVRMRAAAGYLMSTDPFLAWSPGFGVKVKETIAQGLASITDSVRVRAATGLLTGVQPDMSWSSDEVEQARDILEEGIVGLTDDMRVESAIGIITSEVPFEISDAEIPGGIDLNPNNLNLQQQGGVMDFRFDNTILQTIQPSAVQGIVPVIINITPITNFMPLLGMAEPVDSPQLSRLQ